MPTVYSTASGLISTRYSYTIVQFNGYDINNVIEITETALHDSAPSRNFSIYKTARSDGEKLVSVYFSRKEIRITGFIQSTTRQGLETLIDTFKATFQEKNGNLDIEYANGMRRYLATFSELAIQRDPDHIDWCPFSIVFVVPSGKGQDISQTTVTTTGITTAISDGNFNNLGSAEATPQFKITVNSQTALSVMSLTSGGNTLTITRAFNNADIVIIDFSTWLVTVNGTTVNYTGAFPSWSSGNNSFTLTTTATTRNVNLDIIYYPLYL